MYDHPAAIALFIVAVLMLAAGIRTELTKAKSSTVPNLTPIHPDQHNFMNNITELRRDFA